MSAEKKALLERSALCRLRLRGDIDGVRHSLHWSRVAIAVAPPIGRVAFGAALAALGFSRTARWAAVAGRTLLYLKLVRAIVGHVRARGST